MILGVSLILLVIGLSAAAMVRIHNRTVARGGDWTEAQLLATAGVEHALLTIDRTPNWRTALAGRETAFALGGGTVTWRLIDEGDGSLGDGPAEAFAIESAARAGRAAYKLRMTCFAEGGALEALDTALHAGGDVLVTGQGQVTVTGGPLSTNGTLNLAHGHAVVHGDVEAAAIAGPGSVDGDTTVGAPPKALPGRSAFETVRALGTEIPAGADLHRLALGPGTNPFGTPNADGVYVIDAPHSNVTIRDARIYGTLVVRCNRLTLRNAVLMHPFREDLPVLVVDGDVLVQTPRGHGALREQRGRTNFNPPGMPYEGTSDADASDSYPSELRGLIHVLGNMELKLNPLVRGAILCEGELTCKGTPEIHLDPALARKPPLGYTSPTAAIQPGPVRQVVD